MGYTHYWRVNNSASESAYEKAKKDIRKVIKSEISYLANGLGEAKSKPNLKGLISFNGIDENSHESFSIPKDIAGFSDFEFCKTAMKEYDQVVVACLAILKDHLKEGIKISSDGNPEDLEPGVHLASEILKRKIKIPL